MKKIAAQIIFFISIFFPSINTSANSQQIEIITITHQLNNDYNLSSLSTDMILDLRHQLQLEITELTRDQTLNMANNFLENYYIKKLARTFSATKDKS